MSAGNAPKRRGFSLLEMMIALSLGVVLLLALYVTLSNTVQLAQTGREVMTEGATARSIMSRINNDVVNQLGPIDPRMFPDASTTSSDSSDSTSSAPATPAPTPVAYNVGVKGDTNWLQLSVYRIQRTPPGQATDTPDPVVVSDVVRINYWLIGADTQNVVGLARQEIKQATSTDIDLAPKDISDANTYLIADEVKNILFEYYDGTTWQQSWDGTDTTGSLDGATPLGPPAAIRITVTLRRNTQKTPTVTDAPDDATNTYVHVVALPTSNNPAPKTSTTTSP